ncbi:MAG: hypothetical protein HZC22_13435 [Rhodocyclales bacterium]|nr:hypothetical protein [Rhodocyclales bacterium]
MTPLLTIMRGQSKPEGTFGRAEFRSAAETFTVRSLELPWKGNARRVSCIEPGTYRATVRQSPRFKRQVLLLHDVPGRDMIEIHPANWAGDEELGWFSELNGCIALGLGMAPLLNPLGNRQMALRQSNAALDMVLDALGNGKELTVEIVDAVA